MTKTILQGTIREQEDEEDRGRGGRTTSKSGLLRDTKGSRRQEEVETAGFKVIGGAPTTLRVTGLMMMLKNYLVLYKFT